MSYTKTLNLLGNVGYIANAEVLLGVIKTFTGGKEIDVDVINEWAEHEEKCLYMKENGELETRPEFFHQADKKLFYTGYETGNTGEEIYISMLNRSFGYEGGFAGPLSKLQAKARERYENLEARRIAEEHGITFTDDEEDKPANENKYEKPVNKLHNEMYDLLLNKERFGEFKSNGCSKLISYIYVMAKRLGHLIKNKRQGGYILNQDKSMVVFNSALVDKYNNDIFILGTVRKNYLGDVDVVDFSVCESKSKLIQYGFAKEDIRTMPEPLKVWNSVEELNFRASIDEFDLDDRKRIVHILEERIDRFPEKYRDESRDVLYEKVTNAVKNCIRLQDRGYKYIQPMYHIAKDEVQYLIPLHLDAKLSDPPELTLIVQKANGFYSLATVIATEEAYDNARVVEYPNCVWLS